MTVVLLRIQGSVNGLGAQLPADRPLSEQYVTIVTTLCDASKKEIEKEGSAALTASRVKLEGLCKSLAKTLSEAQKWEQAHDMMPYVDLLQLASDTLLRMARKY